MSSYSLGIDLGTTYSVMAVIDESGRPQVIKNLEGKAITPSVIYFGEERPIVGDEAKDQQAFGSVEVASFFKRVMGDPHFTYDFNGKTYDTIELSSLVLKKLKVDAESQLGQAIKNAVITVPAYFNNSQREATIKAGELAGFHVLRIINEPTAAAIAYGLNEVKDNRNIMVYDLGGGTFDVTIASINENEINVLSTNGDHSLGGKDWDDRLAAHFCELFEMEHDMDPLEDEDALNEILVDCENAKKNLTDLTKLNLSIVYRGKKSTFELTRESFENLTSDLIERTWDLAGLALSDGSLTWNDIDDVILVGGSTKMPMVSAFIEQQIGKPPLKGLNVDEVVACGAAIQAKIEMDKLNPTITYSLGSSYKKVQDVMSHTLGMVAINEEYTQYVTSEIIPKNKPIPVTEHRPYQLKTAPNNNNTLEVYVTQGESNIPLECTILGKYTVSNIKHIPKEAVSIDVSYSYDENGVVAVSAVQKETGEQLNVIKEPVPDDLSWMGRPPVQDIHVAEPISVVIAIDLSGSMAGPPLRKAREAAADFVSKMDLNHTHISIMGFANKVRVAEPLSQDQTRIDAGIDQLQTLYDRTTLGIGNKAEPFSDAFKMLQPRNGARFVIVLTDGVWYDQDYAVSMAKRCEREGIEIIAIGFGTADSKFLAEIATSDENALFTNVNSLQQSFSKIAQEINTKASALTFSKR